MKRYAFSVIDRHSQEVVFGGEVEAQGETEAQREHEAHEMAKSQIRDKDMLASLAKGDLFISLGAI